MAPVTPTPQTGEPLAAGLAALGAGQYQHATARFDDARTRWPALDDYALYFAARSEARAGHPERARVTAGRLLALHPDSVWSGAAQLLVGETAAAANDLAAARSALAAARATLAAGSTGWARATLRLAAVEERGGDAPAALALAEELRRTRGRRIVARRGRRLVLRLRAAHPELPPPDHLEEAEQRLREGDARGAGTEAALALETATQASDRARIVWVQAQVERAEGRREAAEASCLRLARELSSDPLAPRALAAAATWRWNADDDAGARQLFLDVTRTFPDSGKAPEAWYAVGSPGTELEFAL